MNNDVLMELVSLVIALSVASERMVEIVKGTFPWLETKKSDARSEGYRRAALHGVAVLAGVLTAALSAAAIPDELLGDNQALSIGGLGLLASGGSSFWNSVLSYLWNAKNMKKPDINQRQQNAMQPGGVS